VEFDKDAAKYTKALDSTTKKRISEKLEKIILDPFDPANSKPLTHRDGERSARVGDYRILLDVDTESKKIYVVAVVPRGQAYR
jgi:mRNA-degrading endonuclease RelE of RelBE toxin-antitoxin system